MCDVFLSATDPGVSNQTNFTFDRVSFKSILGHASILQTGCCSQNVEGNPKPDENATAPKNLFWNLCGQGKGAGREVEAWSSVYIEILLAFTPKSSQQYFSLHSTPWNSPQITKWIFWKMKLHIEDSAIFDGYSACLQIPAWHDSEFWLEARPRKPSLIPHVSAQMRSTEAIAPLGPKIGHHSPLG